MGQDQDRRELIAVHLLLRNAGLNCCLVTQTTEKPVATAHPNLQSITSVVLPVLYR